MIILYITLEILIKNRDGIRRILKRKIAQLFLDFVPISERLLLIDLNTPIKTNTQIYESKPKEVIKELYNDHTKKLIIYIFSRRAIYILTNTFFILPARRILYTWKSPQTSLKTLSRIKLAMYWSIKYSVMR